MLLRLTLRILIVLVASLTLATPVAADPVLVCGCTGGGGGGSGTVTTIATGFGLIGGPISTSGTVSMITPSGDDQVFVSDSASAATWRTLPNCVDTGGNHLNYTQATNTFSCGTSSAAGGGVTSIAGTANQIAASASTGAVTLSIPTNPTLPGTTTGTFSGPLTGNVTGNASTATALAGNGTNCTVGNYPLGIDASGNAENCTALPAGGGSGDVVGPAGGVSDSDLVFFSGTTGKIVKRLSANGLIKMNGASPPSIAAAGTDYTSPTGAEDITNKRIGPRELQLSAASGNVTPVYDLTGADVYYRYDVSGTLNIQIPTGTGVPKPSQTLLFVLHAPSAQTISFATGTNGFAAEAGMALPTGVTAATYTHFGFRWNAGSAKWTYVASTQSTVSGTSGGIPYFNTATSTASSAVLTANMPVIGGGAGAAPTVGTVQGNTTKFVSYAGTAPATNDCAKFDASGNLTTNGSACGGAGGSPSGSNTQVQYNSAGSFAGSAGLTLDSTTVLTLAEKTTPVSANTTLGAHLNVTVDASGAARTITVPAPTAATASQRYSVTKSDSSANAVTLTPSSSTLNGSSTARSCSTQYCGFELRSISATDWAVDDITTIGVNAQSATYQVLASDFDGGKTIVVASGTFTITLVASTSQPANGKFIRVLNYGAGVVTIARSGQNINGATSSLTLQAGSATEPTSAYVISDGTNYFGTVSQQVPPRYVTIECVADATALTTGDGKCYWPTHADFTGFAIVGVTARVGAAVSSSGAVTVGIDVCGAVATGVRCSGTNRDLLSTALTIDANEDRSENAATAAVINAANSTLAAGEWVRWNIDGVGTGTQGLYVTAVLRRP